MSLYDRIRQGRLNDVPDVEVAESVVENVAESPAVETPIVEPPTVAPESPEPERYTYWWQTPDYLGEVERRAASAEKRAEQDRKRVRRERDIAILGDIAKLGVQAFAKNGGAWKIDAFTPATEKANDKLAALRERHAAEVAAFARERENARRADIEDARKKRMYEDNMRINAEEIRRKAEDRAWDRLMDVERPAETNRHNVAQEENYRTRAGNNNSANRGSGSDDKVKAGNKRFSQSEHGEADAVAEGDAVDWYPREYQFSPLLSNIR